MSQHRESCIIAASKLPIGNQQVQYHINSPGAQFRLPIQVTESKFDQGKLSISFIQPPDRVQHYLELLHFAGLIVSFFVAGERSSSMCVIRIEASGPDLPPTMDFRPTQLRGLAAYVIQRCVEQSNTGGWFTLRTNNLFEYIIDRYISLDSRLRMMRSMSVSLLLS